MGKLSDAETERILSKYKVPVPKNKIVKTEKQALAFAKQAGYPVVLKVSSKGISHKTDVGGVFFADDPREVSKGFKQVTGAVRKIKGAKLEGVLIQKKLEGYTELIVGGKIDPQFGAVIMFGLGGIFVEALKDVSFKLLPITRKDVQDMFTEIKGAKILEGLRGKKPVNKKALEDLVLKLASLMVKEKLKEMDFNPVFANHKEAVAVDARLIK